MNIEEVEAFLDTISLDTVLGMRDRTLFELIYSCGLRVSEAVEIEMTNIFLEEGNAAGFRERAEGAMGSPGS